MSHGRGLAMGVLIFASFMDLMDATIVNVALPSIRADLRRHRRPARVDRRRLPAGVRGPDDHRRPARRHLRATRVFVLGVLGFTAGSRAGLPRRRRPRSCSRARVVQGAVRGADGAAGAVLAAGAVRTARARADLRRDRCGLGALGGDRAGARRLAGHQRRVRHRLAQHLPDQPADRAGAGGAGAAAGCPNTRSERPLRLDPLGVVLCPPLGLLAHRLRRWSRVASRTGRGGSGRWLRRASCCWRPSSLQQRRRERRTGSALLPMHLFSDRGFSAGLVTQATFQGSLAGFALALTIYVQTGLGFSAIHAGLTLLPFSLGAFVGTGISVPLGTKLGKVVMVAGALLQSAATVWVLASVRAQATPSRRWTWPRRWLLAGIGLGPAGGAAGRRRAGDGPDRPTPAPHRAPTARSSRSARRWASRSPAWCSSASSARRTTPDSLRARPGRGLLGGGGRLRARRASPACCCPRGRRCWPATRRSSVSSPRTRSPSEGGPSGPHRVVRAPVRA